MTREAVREVINQELLFNLSQTVGERRYLRTIITTSNSHIDAISNAEAQCARVLLLLCSPKVFNIGTQLQELETLLARRIPTDLVFCNILQRIPARACQYFAEQLDQMKQKGQWAKASEAARWLASPNLSDTYPNTVRLLNWVSGDWKKWAVWRPSSDRLQLWERLKPEEREELREILALEAPDDSGQNPTLLASLRPVFDNNRWSIGHGRLVVGLNSDSPAEAIQLLIRVLNILDMAVLTCPRVLPLFTTICTQTVVDTNMLAVLEYIIASKDVSMTAGIQTLLTSTGRNIQVSDLTKVLSGLNRESSVYLRSMLSLHIKNTVEENMARLQNTFYDQLRKKQSPSGVARKLHSLGKALQEAPWLHPNLDERLEFLLRRWPTSEELNILLEVRASAQSRASLTEKIDGDLLAWLTGRDAFREAGNPVQGLIHVWRQPADAKTREVALALANLTTFPGSVRRRCLQQLCDMNERFIARIDLIIKQESDIACVSFAEVLVTGHLMEDGETECWRDLLFCMIEHRRDTIIDSMLAHFNLLESWFKWLNKLEAIFGNILGNQPSTFTMLHRSFYNWNRRLSENYIPSLKSLEAVCGPRSRNLRWLLISWETSGDIIPLLDYVASPNQGRCQRAMQAVASLLLPDGRNALLISKAISLLNGTSPKGAEACLSVLDTRNNSTKLAAEGVLADWLQASEMSSTDNEALKAMSKVINLSIPDDPAQPEANLPGGAQESLPVEVRASSPVEMEASLPAATGHLRREYLSIIDEARRLDKIRLALKNHNGLRTSNLLTRLGIEDPSAHEDAVANIPLSLVDVVEKLSDDEYELCFPLTHLNPPQRAALGIGGARVLLVRFLLETGGLSPGFCTHLHPEHDQRRAHLPISGLASQSSDGHQYWRASSTSFAPDNHFCHGKPNRITYQLNRTCWRLLRRGHLSLEKLYNKLSSEIDNMAFHCVVCGRSSEPPLPPMNNRVPRLIICQPECAEKFERSDIRSRDTPPQTGHGIFTLCASPICSSRSSWRIECHDI
jgi:hypothetical protein